MELKARAGDGTASEGSVTTARKRETRRRILAAALQEFAAEGFDGTSMHAVGDRAGVANGTVFFHFESKSLLYRAVVRHAADAFHAAVSPVARTPGASFLQVVVGQEAFLREHPDIAAVLWSAWGVSPRSQTREGARQVDGRLVGVWRDWIAARRAEPSTDADGLARLVAFAVSGLLASGHVDPGVAAGAALAEFGTFVETAATATANSAGRS